VTVPRGGAKLPRPVAVTAAVRVVFVVTVIAVGLAVNVVLLVKAVGIIFHRFTRLVMSALPRPVAAL